MQGADAICIARSSKAGGAADIGPDGEGEGGCGKTGQLAVVAGQRLIAFGGVAADIAAKGAADFVGGHVGLQNVAPQPDLRIGDARKRRIGDRCSGRQRAVKGGGSANGIWVRHQGVAAQGGQRLDQVAQRAARGAGFGAIRAGGCQSGQSGGQCGRPWQIRCR